MRASPFFSPSLLSVCPSFFLLSLPHYFYFLLLFFSLSSVSLSWLAPCVPAFWKYLEIPLDPDPI